MARIVLTVGGYVLGKPAAAPDRARPSNAPVARRAYRGLPYVVMERLYHLG
jgi:hypothetical protein